MTEALPPIDLYVISGFLGTGKTTFIRGILRELEVHKIGLLMNEFSSVNIDARLFQDSGVQVVEINNGSIFCACLKQGFIKSLMALSKQPIDVLIIESSGMADPSNMKAILDDLSSHLTRKFDYHGEITIVDATSFLDLIALLTPLQKQINSADIILVNKIDLVDIETIELIHRELEDWNPEAIVVDTTFGHIDFDFLTKNLTEHEKFDVSYNTPQTRPESIVIHTDKSINSEDLIALCQDLATTCWRIKGFVKGRMRCDTQPECLHIDAVGESISVSPYITAGDTAVDSGVLVFIGKQIAEPTFDETVIEAWKKHIRNSYSIQR